MTPLPSRNNPEYLSRRQEIMENQDPMTVVRNAHARFRIGVYVLSIFLMTCAITQWAVATRFTAMIRFIRRFNYLGLLGTVIAFLVLISFIFFFKYLIRKHRALIIACVFVTTELGTVVLIRPISEASPHTLLYAMILTVVALVLSSFLSMKRQIHRDYTTKFFILWTVRYFLLSSLGVLICMAIKSPYFDVCVTLIVMFFLLIYILIYGKSMGSLEFFQSEVDVLLYGILSYYNFISLYSTALLFFEKIILFI